MEVYFDNVQLLNGRGTVRLDVDYSGVQLYVPKSWRVDIRAGNSFGEIHEKGQGNMESDNVLMICGKVSFSTVDIIYI